MRVKVPRELPQWLEVGTGSSSEGWVFVRLDEVIAANAEKLFPGMAIEAASLIRVCRDAEVELDDDGLDKRAFVEEEVRQRRFEPVVCLEVQPNADPASVSALREHFGLGPEDVYELRELLDYTTLFEIAALDLVDLHDPPWTPLAPTSLEAHSEIFEAIRAEDILLHHPYDSFDASVERFIREAADDPLTLSIKMTVYRVGDDTPFVRSLIRAAEAGKQVACAIELSARFDEERNLHWARELQSVGAHVVYGVTGLKTHSKTALVVRREQGGIRCYAHVATGNYHRAQRACTKTSACSQPTRPSPKTWSRCSISSPAGRRRRPSRLSSSHPCRCGRNSSGWWSTRSRMPQRDARRGSSPR